MKVEKIVDEKGIVTIIVNEKIGKPYVASRELTGTTDEDNDGVFDYQKEIKFIFGDFRKKFYFNELLDKTLPIEKYCEILVERIKLVRDWVETCKKTEGKVFILE